MKATGSLLHVRWKETSAVRPRRKVGQGGKWGCPGWEFLHSLGSSPLCGQLLGGNLASYRCSVNNEQKDEMKQTVTFWFSPLIAKA